MSRTSRSPPAPDPPADLPDLIRTDGPQRTAVMRLLMFVLAGLFFVLGIIGWLLPVVTGIPFYVLAAVCLGMADKRFARWINERERRLPEKFRRLLRKGRRPRA